MAAERSTVWVTLARSVTINGKKHAKGETVRVSPTVRDAINRSPNLVEITEAEAAIARAEYRRERERFQRFPARARLRRWLAEQEAGNRQPPT